MWVCFVFCAHSISATATAAAEAAIAAIGAVALAADYVFRVRKMENIFLYVCIILYCMLYVEDVGTTRYLIEATKKNTMWSVAYVYYISLEAAAV